MFLIEIFEEENAPKNTPLLVIYPGRFQPFHKGHRAVYNYLVKRFGRDRVYIATSSSVDPPKSPFNFSQKLAIMQLMGIPIDRVIETRDPYKASELMHHISEKTRVIFAIGQKDMDENPRFANWTKKDGSPSYFQPMPRNARDMQARTKHGYIMIVPTFDFTVLGQPMQSASEFRSQFARANDTRQQAMIQDLFGSYDKNVHAIMKSNIREDATGVEVVANKQQKTILDSKTVLQSMFKQTHDEISKFSININN